MVIIIIITTQLPNTTNVSETSIACWQEVYEELENLRKLVQKYRLELSNREGNFNRMFTEKTPDRKSVV